VIYSKTGNPPLLKLRRAGIISASLGNYLYAGNQSNSYANPHAVTSIGASTFAYDKNGNMASISF